MNEENRIRKHYAERKGKDLDQYFGKFDTYNRYKREERDKIIAECVREHFSSVNEIRMLEVGAGRGGNLDLFTDMGIDRSNIYANDLLEENREDLEKFIPVENIQMGNALVLDFSHKFDLVFLSLVFTSIIDDEMRRSLAQKVADLCKPGGLIICYDFAFDNPSNKQVKGIGKTELKKLFSFRKDIKFYKVTLAPPIGRRIGSLYFMVNALPFLRSHLIAVIKK